jgi:hypothetical protein
MRIVKQKALNGRKIYIYYDYGRGAGGRVSANLFLWAKPSNAIEKAHNKDSEKLI